MPRSPLEDCARKKILGSRNPEGLETKAHEESLESPPLDTIAESDREDAVETSRRVQLFDIYSRIRKGYRNYNQVRL